MNLSLILILTLNLAADNCKAQSDSILAVLQKIPVTFITRADNNIDSYCHRLKARTGMTLEKLSHWENKIKSLLEKLSPETSEKLFGNNQATFSTILQKIKGGKSIAAGYTAKYSEYRDKLTATIDYLNEQKDLLDIKLVDPVIASKKKLSKLELDVSNAESVEIFIKERKKQLLSEALQYIRRNKYLEKIDKEAYYYAETLSNYREIFSDKIKAEETVLNILNKIPAFNKFVQEHGMLARLFGSPGNPASTANLQGLQTRAGVNALIQNQIAAGGPNGQEVVQQNWLQALAEIGKLKDKVMQMSNHSSSANIPEFKVNPQKSKTFLQRLEIGSNFQYTRNNKLLPALADMALSLGYKLNDRSVIGIGASYKMGLGSMQKISISHQGIGLRSFIDWKLKRQFFMTGGFEMNYQAQFKNITLLKYCNNWQQSGLLGLTKKLNSKAKYFKSTSIQILYDMLYQHHVPVSQPVLFRTGYSF